METAVNVGMSREQTEEQVGGESPLEAEVKDPLKTNMDAFKEPKLTAEDIVSLSERMTYKEHPAYAIAQALRDNGYELADCIGTRLKEIDDTSCIGILKPQGYRKFLGLFRVRNKSLFIGKLILDSCYLDSSKGAKPLRNWEVKVYGRDNAHDIALLIKRFAENYNVTVEFELDNEESKKELGFFY